MTVLDFETPHGLARAHIQPVDEALGALALGHGAGGGINARDLATAAEVARGQGFSVALVEQLKAADFEGLPLVTGGRSAGARIACRTFRDTGSIAVLCLAFPVHPPQRASAKSPERPTRQPELDAVTVPTLVVQGVNDRFGMPTAGRTRTVVKVPGDHRLTTDLGAVGDAVRKWLPQALRAWAATRA